MRVGFIGTGSMGSILLEAFISEKALKPDQITASNRTREKVKRLSEKYPGLTYADDNIQVVKNSQLIFICVKPLEFKTVIEQIKPWIEKDHLIVSITSPILIQTLEEQIPCKIAKIIPSITNLVGAGASLMMFGSRVKSDDRDFLRKLFEKISKPIEIKEEFTRVSSDIVSCGPAFLSFLLQRFISAAVEETGINQDDATFLTTEMIIGFAKLISEGPFDLATLQQRVVVPGGVTGAGLIALGNIGDTFNQMYHNTHEKYRTDLREVEVMFEK
ncbi:late competence protein ComER [Ammoniphilus resinae]|uniref:Pyrroline-5-carboxylate reductase n=1 Tax=Ammoniphilus resinae TaxID=861532 RepID=A0ABS4GKQ7_9BACL|nr:late competence protein ComER [Ammoniphilus resinae]MBP1930490.1 competence protein ComER [Ammoniphilus resinae]